MSPPSAPPKRNKDVTPAPAAIAPTARKIELVKLADIVDDPENHRLASKEDEQKIQELMGSMAKHGLEQPVLLYRDINGRSLHRVYGFRRITAAKRIGWTEIPAQILAYIPAPDEREARRGIENLHRKNLNPAEEALAVVKVVDTKRGDVAAAAAELGYGETWVRDRLHLQRLTKKNRELLAAGKINLGQARRLATVGDETRQNFWGSELAGRFARGEIVKIDTLDRWLAQERHSLRVVGWELEVAFAGKPACVGCPNNTASDRTLFGTTASDEGHDKGFCLNPSCYDAKVRAVGAATEKAVEKIQKQVKEKKIEKGEAATAAVVRDVIPDFVKEGTAQRAVAAKVGPVTKAETPAAGSRPVKETVDPKQRAVEEWGAVFEKWREGVLADVQVAAAKGHQRLLSLILPGIRAIVAQKLTFYDPCANGRTPAVPSTTPPNIAQLLNVAANHTYESLLALADEIDDEYPESFEEIMSNSWTPDMVERFALAFKVECEKAPTFEAFERERNPPPSPKPAKKANDASANAAPAGVDKSAAAAAPVKLSDDETLVKALSCSMGCLLRWTGHQETGLTDRQLSDAIAREWNGCPSALTDTHAYATMIGTDGPKIWIGDATPNGKPTLQGKELLAKVRELMEVGLPKSPAKKSAGPTRHMDGVHSVAGPGQKHWAQAGRFVTIISGMSTGQVGESQGYDDRLVRVKLLSAVNVSIVCFPNELQPATEAQALAAVEASPWYGITEKSAK